MSTGKMKQDSFTGKIRPTVSLVSMTSNPIGTIFSVWYGSRHSYNVNASDIQYLYRCESLEGHGKFLHDVAAEICRSYPEHAGVHGNDYKNVIRKIVQQVLQADLPPSESVNFTFEIDDASIAWREQLVRSKIATYWTQTSRTQDLSTMDVTMNDSVELLGGDEAVEIYESAVDVIRKAYADLMRLGVPAEDIRLQPQGHTHRVYWMISLRSLIKILNKRSDWIAQASLWTPIIAGVCSILRNEGMMDILQEFIGKPFPTVSYNPETSEYYISEHPQTTENEDRFYGRDPIPVDPLYLAYTGESMPPHTNIKFYDYMKSLFIQIWSDPYLRVLGWDRDHPEVLGKYDRPVS